MWHIRVLVSRMSILVSLVFGWLFWSSFKCQVIYDTNVIFKSLTHRITCILLEKFRSKARISWNLSLNLTDLFFRRHSNNHQFVFLVPHPDLYELISLHQCTSVESGMILLSAHTIEPSVQHDDDKWNHLEWNLFVTGNTNSPSFWYIRTSFAFSLLTYISDTSNLSISSISAIRTSPFEIPVAIKA